MAKPKWVSISPTSGNNDGSFDVTAQTNGMSPARKGIITVAGGGINKTIDVNQRSNKLILQRVQQVGPDYFPTKVKDPYRYKEYNLTPSSKYSAEINTDFVATLIMVYPGIGTGSTHFVFQFSIDLDEITLSMDDGSDISPYISGRINDSNPTQFIFHLGNGYPEISNTRLTIVIKAGTQTMIIYYTNNVDA